MVDNEGTKVLVVGAAAHLHEFHRSFHERISRACRGDENQRFELRASLNGEPTEGHAWTNDVKTLPRLVSAFEKWPAMSGLIIFDRLKGQYLKPEDVYMLYGAP